MCPMTGRSLCSEGDKSTKSALVPFELPEYKTAMLRSAPLALVYSSLPSLHFQRLLVVCLFNWLLL
jgi:hypothetical protein